MKELYMYSKKLVNCKIKKEIDSDILDILTISVFGILLFYPEADKKLGKILDKLNIFFDENKYIFIKNKYKNIFVYDESGSSYTRSISCFNINSINETEVKFFDDKKYLFILNKENLDVTISEVIHSLLHFLRFNGYYIYKNNIVRKDGLCYTHYDSKNNFIYQNNLNFEEGIIQKHVEDIIILLKENIFYIYDINTSMINFKNKIINYDFSRNNFNLQTEIVDTLSIDTTFDSLLKNSYNENTIPSNVELYFNNKNNNLNNFNDFSKTLDLFIGDSLINNLYNSKLHNIIFNFLHINSSNNIKKKILK